MLYHWHAIVLCKSWIFVLLRMIAILSKCYETTLYKINKAQICFVTDKASNRNPASIRPTPMAGGLAGSTPREHTKDARQALLWLAHTLDSLEIFAIPYLYQEYAFSESIYCDQDAFGCIEEVTRLVRFSAAFC